jgi:hypothetical protein
MKAIVKPKCPYCHVEFKEKSPFENPLSSLYGEYCQDAVKVICQKCGNEYYVSKQTRFIARKNK